jgi:phosphatidate cytidylyltransferase
MGGADPARPSFGSRTGVSELAQRVGSALVLAPLALGTAYVGGWTFAVFWAVAAAGVFWEWTALVSSEDRRSALIVGGLALLLASSLVASGVAAGAEARAIRLSAALIILALAIFSVALLAPAGRRAWLGGGIPYAAAIGIAPIVLRAELDNGFVALVLLFAVVWTTDIAAYFVGRTIGGPKLAPRWSPNKTWSGAIGGVIGAVPAAAAVAMVAGIGNLWPLALLAVSLSVAAQVGDLFESVMKRRFGAKDSSHLIPGHGGLMDRVDGFVAAAVLACAIGIARGGIEAPARGLLIW